MSTDFQNGFVTGYAARAQGAGNLEQVQANYTQNDDTAVDYIQNRPFYKKEEIITLFNSFEGDKKNVANLNLNLVAGQNYEVTFNYTDGTSEVVEITALPEEAVEYSDGETDNGDDGYILKYSGAPLSDNGFNADLLYYLEKEGQENKCIYLGAETEKGSFALSNNLGYGTGDDGDDYAVLEFGKATYLVSGNILSVSFTCTTSQLLPDEFQVHADYLENDPSKAGFIENRPFYSSTVIYESKNETKYDSAEDGTSLVFTNNESIYISELTSIAQLVDHYSIDTRLIIEIPTGMDSEGNITYTTLTREFETDGYYTDIDTGEIVLNGGSIGTYDSYGGDISLKYSHLPSTNYDYLYYQDKDNSGAVQIYLKPYAKCDNGVLISEYESYLTQYEVPIKVIRIGYEDYTIHKRLSEEYLPESVVEIIESSPESSDNKVVGIYGEGSSTQYPATKAVVDYIMENRSDYEENDETSPAFIKNRPFYTSDSETVTETFYNSSEGDPTAEYISNGTKVYCSQLANITGLESNFAEGATIEASLGVTYNSSKSGTITRTSTVKKYSDEIFYVGSWYWLEEDSTYTADEDFLITYNITTGKISIYLSASITISGYNIVAGTSKSVVLTSTITTNHFKQLDTKYIPDYISKTDMMTYVAEQIALLKAELQSTTTE